MASRPEQRLDPVAGLGGAHVFLTGVTGFIGQAILEKLLTAYPTTRISVLIRPRKGVGGEARLKRLLRKPVFGPWRERVGNDEIERTVAERVTVVEGGLDAVADLPGDLDVVIHGASTVTFDEPIDRAFATNVSGAVSLYDAIRRSGGDPHVVHVSTAYIAGVRKGLVPEASHPHAVDWRVELAAAQAARHEVETASRRPEVLRKALATARAEHGKAGPQAVASAAEEARQDWVDKRLVDYGRLRAQSLGWPDVYTFSKSLGERVAEELWAADGDGHRLSVVRPAIVESALQHPYPGWIDGFKVADPLIVAYGRGLLPEFPGLPDSVLDIVPVDTVVNTTLAVAAAPPPPREPQYFHVCSGARNPLPFRGMYEMVHEYFTAHPMPDSERGHIQVPNWRFPARSRIERTLRYSERGIDLAEKAVIRLPASPRTRSWMSFVQRRHKDIEALRGYADLYQAYTGTEIVYDDSRTFALHRSLPADRVAEHGFDTGAIDWHHYLQEVHFPGVTTLMRTFSGRSRSRGGAGGGAERGFERRPDVLAVFDLEGTVVAANVVEQYLWVKLASLPRSRWPSELFDLARSVPAYLRAERRDRGEFVRAFARRYAGVDEAALRDLVADAVGDALLQRVMPEAVRRIRAHREAGHRTVLVTGTIDVLVEPLAPLVDEVVAARMHSRDGIWTGYLDTPPLVDEARAAWLTRYACDLGADLSGSYAYGDSHADRVWLELVGNPEVVNPDAGLFRHASRKNWRVHTWGRDSGGRLDALLAGVSTPRPSAPAPRTTMSGPTARPAAEREVSA